MKIDEIYKNIENYEENNNINWTKVWSKKYPILNKYDKEVDVEKYKKEIRRLLNELKQENKYNELDAMLILKDILAKEYFSKE